MTEEKPIIEWLSDSQLRVRDKVYHVTNRPWIEGILNKMCEEGVQVIEISEEEEK
jgi:hypothetical protein